MKHTNGDWKFQAGNRIKADYAQGMQTGFTLDPAGSSWILLDPAVKRDLINAALILDNDPTLIA